MNLAYLLIGGNLGDRIKNITSARNYVEKEIGKIINASSIYETASWGIEEQPDFLNQVLFIQTILSAKQVITILLAIENKMGRVRSEKNASRIIDIDILFFNNDIINEPSLKIPHPQIQNRKFTLVPLFELAPEYIHPVLQKPIKELLANCKDALQVKKYKNA